MSTALGAPVDLAASSAARRTWLRVPAALRALVRPSELVATSARARSRPEELCLGGVVGRLFRGGVRGAVAPRGTGAASG
eukprot:10357763-Alexandrium_andersonii.AAC.1